MLSLTLAVEPFPRRGTAAGRERQGDRSGGSHCRLRPRWAPIREGGSRPGDPGRPVSLCYRAWLRGPRRSRCSASCSCLGHNLGSLASSPARLCTLAGKSTSNRLEHAPGGPDRYHRIGHDAAAIEDLFVTLFPEAHEKPPKQIILDLDATDDPGFARDDLMVRAEANRVHDLFGLVRNSRPVAHIHVALAWAEEQALKTGQPARRFADFRWNTRDSRSRRRRAIAKAEWMAGRGDKGATPRFVVTSLKPEDYDARTLCEERDCARGDRERVAPGFALHRGLPARPLRRPHLACQHAGQSAPPPVRLLRLCPTRCLASHRPATYPTRQGHLRHSPKQTPQNRRADHPFRQTQPHPYGLRLPLRRQGPYRPCQALLLTAPQQRPDRPHTTKGPDPMTDTQTPTRRPSHALHSSPPRGYFTALKSLSSHHTGETSRLGDLLAGRVEGCKALYLCLNKQIVVADESISSDFALSALDHHARAKP